MGAEGVWVVGAGRIGLSLALLLHRAGAAAPLTVSGRRPAPPDHPLFAAGAARYQADLSAPSPPPALAVIAVADADVAAVAERLAPVLAPPTVVLHTSGALGSEALRPLAQRGCPVGSLHPLAAVADPLSGADRLRGAWFAAEGDPGAVEAARGVVEAAGGRLLEINPAGKPLYHAAAVLASNYLVALFAAAERLLAASGAPPAEGRAALLELARGALANLEGADTAAALTGPVSRGDAETVRRHLDRLSPPDAALYSTLGREALSLARRRGLDADAARRLEILLGEDA